MAALRCRSITSLRDVPERKLICLWTPARQLRATHVAFSHTSTAVAAASVVEAPPSVTGPTTNAADSERSAVREIDPSSFYDFISGDGLCVVDYYTDWCGPCKVMHKEVDKMTSAFKSVKFAKLNCGNCQDFSNRQRIRSLPTFRLYHKGTCLDEITGAKPTQLRQLLTHWLCMTTIS